MKTIKFNSHRNCGMFSTVFEFLVFCHNLERYEVEYIDVESFTDVYFDKTSSDKCSFQHFFKETIKNIKIDYNFNLPLFNALKVNNYDVNDLLYKYENRVKAKYLIEKYLTPTDIITNKIDNYYKLFDDKKILGVHVRLTDHDCHGELLSLDKYFDNIDSNITNYDNLYLMTDEANIIDKFKARYNSLIILDDIIRSENGEAIHVDTTLTDNYKKGEDIIIETWLLSKCDRIIVTNSNISTFAISLNPELEFNFIDINHKNYE